MKTLTATLNTTAYKIGAGVIAVIGMVAAVAGVAGAATYDPTSGLTTFAGTVGTTAGPIVLAVAGALIGLALLFWGVRYAFSFIGHRSPRR